jgi:dephospho-CoA kinase
VIILGLTGSIAMGKSTVAAMFAAEGAPVFDSDAAVHAIYRSAGAQSVEAVFPGVLREGAIDRDRLAARVIGDPAALARLEGVVHPMVEAAPARNSRREFLAGAAARNRRVVVVDAALLFESGADRSVDVILVVSASELVQKERAFARPGMTRPSQLAVDELHVEFGIVDDEPVVADEAQEFRGDRRENGLVGE